MRPTRHLSALPGTPGEQKDDRFPLPWDARSLLGSLLLVASLLASPSRAEPLRVGKITLSAGGLFDREESQPGLLHRAANLLHRQTPEGLLRRFLLFHEGDAFDQTLLQESERNLRSLDFLESVSIVAAPPHDGVIDVIVKTEDAFTTDANGDYSNDGGKSLYDFAVTQKDILGRGGEVDLRVASLRERSTRSLELLHPALFGPYWNADLLLASSSDGNEQRVSIDRPLFSYRNADTISAIADHLLQDGRTYEEGRVATRFQQKHRNVTFAFGRVIASAPQRASRLLLGADWIDDRFGSKQGSAPLDRRFHFLEAGYDTLAFDYIKLDHVDFGQREQDYNVGAHGSLFAAASPGARTGGVVYRLRTDDSIGRRLGDHGFVISRLAASTRARARNRNAMISSDTRMVHRSGMSRPVTLVARLRVDCGSDLDRDVQFFADGQNGLRAYPNFAFNGSRRVVFNVEQRIFLGHEWLQLFEPGAAVFVDSGKAWSRDHPSDFGRLRTDAGAGLRLGIARFESTMLRLDVAYALNDSPISKRGIVISFATSQAF